MSLCNWTDTNGHCFKEAQLLLTATSTGWSIKPSTTGYCADHTTKAWKKIAQQFLPSRSVYTPTKKRGTHASI
jgi:hypothetical protein